MGARLSIQSIQVQKVHQQTGETCNIYRALLKYAF